MTVQPLVYESVADGGVGFYEYRHSPIRRMRAWVMLSCGRRGTSLQCKSAIG